MTLRRVALLVTAALAVAGAPAASAPPVPAEAGPAVYAGDFDGDGTTDLYRPGPGGAPEVLLFGGAATLATETVPLAGTFEPLVGDFDGDGADDVFHYAAGPAPDALWYGGADRGMTQVAAPVRGTYAPVVGDFDGDGRADVLWYAAGEQADRVWYGQADRGFRAVPVAAGLVATPAVGDFDGDGRSDVRWYAGTKSESVWYGRAGGGFETVRVAGLGAGYRPVVADYDGDGAADVLWYRQRTPRSFVEFGSRLRTSSRVEVTLPPDAGPITTGDLDGDRAADAVIVADDEARILYGSPGRVLSQSIEPAPGGSPVAADVTGDGRADVHWSRTGRDTLWVAGPFRSIATEGLRTRPNRVPVLDPTVWAERYTPVGFVAHAMGGIDGRRYTNSLEAFRHNYAAGFRVFEVDFVTLRDGTILAQHDGTEDWLGMAKSYKEATYADVRGRKMFDKYTVLTGGHVLSLLRKHRDAYVVIDAKWSRTEIIRRLLTAASDDPQVARRLLPHIAGQEDLDEVRRHYPLQHYVVALYRTQTYGRFDNPEVLEFVRRNDTPAVMMWFRPRDRSQSLAWNGRNGRRYEPAFAEALQRAGAVVYVHSIGEAEIMREFGERRIGVYSDGPLGPKYPVPMPLGVDPLPGELGPPA